MTSLRQIEANRRNASKSTGPTTEKGKQRSRCNAVRHGLAAETMICALEDAEDYKAFETAITADYDAQSAVERELVLRLASLLWRLRPRWKPAFRNQGRPSKPDQERALSCSGVAGDCLCDLWALVLGQRRQRPVTLGHNGRIRKHRPATIEDLPPVRVIHPSTLRASFLSLTNLPNFALDRLSRYEAALWRQVTKRSYHSTPWIAANHKNEGRRLGIQNLSLWEG